MRMTGIEFRQRHDRPFGGLYALLHTIGTMIAYATSLQIVSIILMLITSRKQGLVDLILATVVVNRAAGHRRCRAPFGSPSLPPVGHKPGAEVGLAWMVKL